jgi:hypothetical protein
MPVDHTSYDPVVRFEEWLLSKAPELRLRIDQARVECGRPSTPYWFLSFVVRPHIEELTRRGDEAQLARFWALLEEIARAGSHSERQSLAETLEEFDIEQHRRWLSPVQQVLAAPR